ncbi:monooxygenase [Sphingomonas sp. Leaf412]|uniref:flavin-containing monooxygenase n=1 Tax=Sphingomonas sp. Leaf412 TaxID=1736370 RepID=UPI0006F9B547|nr:NAD(P)/FAD-dependent oxidoreductase [Sphingomonas sp. Leaf412]KQT32525.1 monooxygenase [Sphingomonas sp. Leaf412]
MTIDRDTLLARYAAERDKRLRPEGTAQYIRLDAQFADRPVDVQAPVADRAPVTDDVTFAFVGGGFAGLVTGARLAEAGVTDVRIVEKGGDVGGTWYWNRYPGAQCDTASMVYMPLLEETQHRPTEKYAHGPEILAQCRRIAERYGLYDKALFHTEVTGVTWDEARARWVIETNRNDRFTARFIGLGTGPLHVPKLPRIPGIADFRGHSFHTSRWDYAYTGGDPDGAPLDRLADKRVAIIGTGATAVQAVPHLAAAAQQLYVVQRTPSSVDVRDNGPIDPDWFSEVAVPGWQARWLENFTDNQAGGNAREDWVKDGWTDLSRRIRARLAGLPREAMTREAMLAAYEESDFEKMEEIRARVDAVVADAGTAEGLKAWYRQLCKRPCFHDDYLAAFNRPGVQLVDTGGKGVERITERGFVVAGREYAVDCIVWASGFEVGSEHHERAGFDPVGRDGVRLSDVWAEGMRSLHGIHVHGFPNAFFVQPAQGANLISNVPHNLTESASTIAPIVRAALDRGAREVDVTAEAQERWVKLLLDAPPRLIGGPDCTPGYYNNEGQDPTPAMRLAVGYPAGPSAYFRYLAKWRDDAAFAGLEFR